MGKIPEGWLPYSPIGNQVPGTRFIAFKVPLREAFVDKLKPDDRFTIGILLDKIPDLGLVIDLTNTSKYYNKREFLDRGVDYVKIPTPGQTIPPQHLVDRFFEVIDYYLETHDNDNTLIGVHCTHGVNRTGYMLCRYLIQRLEYPFEDAIEAVGRARGHMIERSPYIASLQDNVESVQKKSSSIRSIEGSMTKLKKEAESKKEEIRRRGSGKDRVRAEGDFRTSPGRQTMAPSIRQIPGMRTRSPPLQQPPRGRTSPISGRGRLSSPIYDRPSTGQHRVQATLIRERMQPPMSHGRSPPSVHSREPEHYRDLTPPPPRINSHYPPVSMRERTPPSSIMRERSPHRVQGRVRSPLPVIVDHIPSRGRSPTHLRGRSPSRLRAGPPVRVRSRSPRYRTGRTPPPPSRGRSPGRSARGRTPPPYRPPSPLHAQMPPPSNTALVRSHASRRDQLPPSRGRSPPPSRIREPAIHSRRERTPPTARTSKRPHSPDYRRTETALEPYYEMRYGGYEDNRKPVEDIPREYADRYEHRDFYNSDRVHGSSGEYYTERYEKPRRERSASPGRHQSYYPNQREGKNERPEFSPPREKRRRKSPVPEVREKIRRTSPPSGYLNSDDGLKREKRSRNSYEWEQVKSNDGPDCREILNEKRSLRDVYPESIPPVYSDISKYPSSNSDLRDVLEEEKRRRHGHADPPNYRGDDAILDERDRVRQNYSSHGYSNRSEVVERDRGRPRQDYDFTSSSFDDTLGRSERQHRPGYQDDKLYAGVLNHQSQESSIKARDDEFRKPRRTRGGGAKHRFFDRAKGGGRSRGGGFRT